MPRRHRGLLWPRGDMANLLTSRIHVEKIHEHAASVFHI